MLLRLLSIINSLDKGLLLNTLQTKAFYPYNNFYMDMPNKNIIDMSQKKPALSFRGAPWLLEQNHYYISANDAINLFDKLKLGNFLDHGGKLNDSYYKDIRRNNLAFLDKLQTDNDKKKFIDHYKEVTGFPNLSNISKKIKSEFVNGVKNVEEYFSHTPDYYEYKVLAYGYDGVSSVAKEKALPGSDLDKAYVVISGSQSLYYDEEAINNFKGKLWENTDQRVLSYNHDLTSFPQVYSSSQFNKITRSILNKTRQMDLRDYTNKSSDKFSQYKDLTKSYDTDYVRANKFFIDLCKKYPCRNNFDLNPENPSREDIYCFGYLLEALFKGENFKNNLVDLNKNKDLKDVVDLINVSQIEALKKSKLGFKDKYQARSNLQTDFDNWPINKQFDFIKTTIKSSCTDYDGKFPSYFKTSESDRFQELMNAIGVKG